MTSLSVGSTLQNGKYEIVKVLGQGGFGITYLATHSILEKQVAIKEFFPKDFCDRDSDTSHITLGTSSSAELVGKLRIKFVKEAKNIAKLSHPNIVPIQDIFEENNTAYYLMDYIEGESLGDIIKRDGALSEDIALHYIRQIASAIDYMHSRSMNHLDIKPGNIMIRKSDNMPILIDFGTSKQYDNEGEQTSTMAPGFTHGYAPIEQYKPGGVSTFTPQTDIYALGATLYALLTGKKPPHYSEILEDGLPSLGENISVSTVEGVEHAMEVRKNKRPASISEFLAHFVITAPKNTIIEDKVEETITQSEVETRMDDDTVYAEVVSTPPNFKEEKVEIKQQPSNSDVIDGIEFVDLGLSVLWANMNIGAKRADEFGVYVNKVDSSTTGLVAEWNLKGALVPTIAQFEELKSKCYWEPTEYYGVSGYDVKGKNGNKIFIPLSGDNNHMGFVNFGRLFTRESLYNDSATSQYYFYFNRQGDYKSQHYACDYICPVRLVRQKK